MISKRNTNKYVLHNDYAEIIITSPMYGIFNIKVDLEDVEKLKQNVWGINRCWNKKTNKTPNYYAGCCNYNGSGKSKLMHRILINAPKDRVVDHINHDTCDNRKSNLRLCTQKENLENAKQYITNKSGRRGVCWDKIQNKWMAFIMKDYHHHTLGYFDDINQAIECRRKAEIKYFGEYKNQDII